MDLDSHSGNWVRSIRYRKGLCTTTCKGKTNISPTFKWTQTARWFRAYNTGEGTSSCWRNWTLIRGESLEEKVEFMRDLKEWNARHSSSSIVAEYSKHRHSVVFRALCDKSIQVDSITVDEWKKRVPALLRSYAAADVSNANETGLFFTLLLGRSMVLSNDRCKGGKHSEVRYPILLCAN